MAEISISELTDFISQGLVLLLGDPLTAALFAVALLVIWMNRGGLSTPGIAIILTAGLTLFMFSGIVPEWWGYMTLVIVSMLLAAFLTARGWV